MVTNIEDLTINQLNLLLGNMKLGEDHLKNKMTRNEYDRMINSSALSKHQHSIIKTSAFEKLNDSLLTINTMVTSAFGAWMGLASFRGWQLNSFPMFSLVTSITLICSLILGYYDLKLTKNNIIKAINNQKIHNIQYEIINLLIKKQQRKIISLTKYINQITHYFYKHTANGTFLDPKQISQEFVFNNDADFAAFYKQLNLIVLKKMDELRSEKYHAHSRLLKKIITQIEKLLFTQPNAEKEKINKTYNLLSKPIASQTTLTIKTWLRSHFLSLLTGIIPTFLGGFASMFVFLAGGPDLAQQLGYADFANKLHQPQWQFIEFSIALGLTIYYASTFSYSRYKMYLRDKTLTHSKKKISQQEHQSVKNEEIIYRLEVLKAQLIGLIHIYKTISRN